MGVGLLCEGGTGVADRGRVKGTRETAIAACKAAIDKWLEPQKNDGEGGSVPPNTGPSLPQSRSRTATGTSRE